MRAGGKFSLPHHPWPARLEIDSNQQPSLAECRLSIKFLSEPQIRLGADATKVHISAMMTSRFALLAAVIGALSLAPAYGQDGDTVSDANTIATAASSAAQQNQLTEADLEVVDAASAYLNQVRTVRARFHQVARDPSSGAVAEATGEMHISRPGLMRLEFDAPQEDPNLVISDGSVVRMRNAGLGCVDEFSLRATPLHLFLKNDVDLARDAEIVAVSDTDAGALITLRDKSDDIEGLLTMNFARPAIELRGWTVIDSTGQETETRLLDAVRGESFNRSLFVAGNDWPRDRGGYRDCGE